MHALADPFINIVIAVGILIAGLLLILTRWGKPDRFVSRSAWAALVADFGPIALCFALLVICTCLVWHAYQLKIDAGNDLSHSILPGFFASLVEDIVFFSAIGIVLFVLQRREFERGRNIDDRLDTLFNGKRLTAEELSALKDQVRQIGCDFQQNDAIIDITDYDPVHQCVQIDVTRRWSLASYFRDESAVYEWEINLLPDDIPVVSPLMEIFPSQQRVHHRDKRKVRISEVKTLHRPIILKTPERFVQKFRVERIEPNTRWEFRLRYRAWQRLLDADGNPDCWEFKAQKHWDSWSIKVTNSLPNTVRVKIDGTESRDVELGSGATQDEALELTNLAPGSKVRASFDILS